jgi:hypothetical protein
LLPVLLFLLPVLLFLLLLVIFYPGGEYPWTTTKPVVWCWSQVKTLKTYKRIKIRKIVVVVVILTVFAVSIAVDDGNDTGQW